MMGVEDALDRSRFSGFQKAIFAMCFLIVLLDGFDTAAIGYVAPALVVEWGVAKPQLAPVLSAALFDCFASQGESLFADKMLSAMRYAFGGHLEKPKGKA